MSKQKQSKVVQIQNLKDLNVVTTYGNAGADCSISPGPEFMHNFGETPLSSDEMNLLGVWEHTLTVGNGAVFYNYCFKDENEGVLFNFQQLETEDPTASEYKAVVPVLTKGKSEVAFNTITGEKPEVLRKLKDAIFNYHKELYLRQNA